MNRLTLTGLSVILAALMATQALSAQTPPRRTASSRGAAARLSALDVASESGKVSVRLSADGPIRHRASWLQQTGRILLVVDLPELDVTKVKPTEPFPVPLLHVGLSQWKSSPLVGRLTLHLPSKRSWSVDTSGPDWILTILDEQPPDPGEATSPALPRAAARIRPPKPPPPPRLHPHHSPRITPPPHHPAPPPQSIDAAPRNDTDKRVTLLFRNAELANVLRVIGEQNHLSVILPPDIAGSVTVFLENVPVEEALRKILFVHGYGFLRSDDILLVVPGVNDRANYRIYRPPVDQSAKLFATLAKIIPAPGKLHRDESTGSLILYAPHPGIRPVFESIYNGLLAGASPAQGAGAGGN